MHNILKYMSVQNSLKKHYSQQNKTKLSVK